MSYAIPCHGHEPCLTNAGRDSTAGVVCPGGAPIKCDCGEWICWWCGDVCDAPKEASNG